MNRHTDALLKVASAALCGQVPTGVLAKDAGRRLTELHAVLRLRNGFYAFESALHVRGTCAAGGEPDLASWNQQDAWRADYGDLAAEGYFFAADAFGGQFAIVGEAVQKFDPETGACEYIAATLDDWAGVVLDDYQAQTGWPLVRQWQAQHGQLASGYRLVPVTPFVLGGAYSVQNLRATTSEKAMHYYANLARQLRDLPDGARVRLRVVD